MTGHDAEDQPCWSTLSEELATVLRKRGPVLIGDSSGAYESVHGKQLKLHGHGLRECLSKGRLQGVVFNSKTGKLELEKDEGGASQTPNTTRAKRSRRRKPTATAAVRTKPTPPSTVAKRPPSPTVTRPRAPTAASPVVTAATTKPSKKLPARHTVATTAKSPATPATRHTAKSTTTRNAAATKTRPTDTTSTLPTTSPTAPAVPPSCFQASDSAMPRDECPEPAAPQSSYLLVDSIGTWEVALASMFRHDTFCFKRSLKRICEGRAVAVQLEGRRLGAEDGSISIIKIAGSWRPPGVVIFDVAALERSAIGRSLLRVQLFPMLSDESSTKVVHDFTSGAVALRRYFGDKLKIGRFLDTQLAFEALHGDVRASVGSVIKAFTGEQELFSDAAYRAMAFEGITNSRIPIDPHELTRAARTATSLSKAGDIILKTGLTKEQRDVVLQASKMKLDFAMKTLDNTRWMTFRDEGQCWGGGTGRVVVSYELNKAREITGAGSGGENGRSSASSERTQHLGENGSTFGARIGSFLGRTKPIDKDVNCPLEVLQLVPKDFLKEHLSSSQKQNLQDIQELVLDEGRRPKALLQGRPPLFLCSDENRFVTARDIDKVVGRLDREGRFGDDNRAGFPGRLHRLSVMRRKQQGQIFAATLRIGRFFKGSAGVIDDILFHVVNVPGKPKRAASILVLGEAGSGKTTVIRDICRKTSATQTVVIVDTSNEIAGDGNIPHREAIGESRRIMVPVKADQHKVMTEALQNHTPQTIVVDEISNTLEARACQDIKARGVRLVASAHGDLQSLLKNPNLNTLVGGTTSVTVGDKAAAENGGNKVHTQRAGAPVFDMVIELKRGEVGTWSIIRNVAVAVDALLEGGSYEVERRSRAERDSQPGNKDPTSEDVAFRLAYDREAEKAQLLY